MKTTRFLAALVLAAGLVPAPYAQAGPVRAVPARAPGPSMPVAPAISGNWSRALSGLMGVPGQTRASVPLQRLPKAQAGAVLPQLGRLDVANPRHQQGFVPAVRALEALGHSPETFQAMARSDEGLALFRQALDMAQADIRRRVAEKAAAVGSGADDYSLAVDLMELRAQAMLYMDKETLAALDGAVARAGSLMPADLGGRLMRASRALAASQSGATAGVIDKRDFRAILSAMSEEPAPAAAAAAPAAAPPAGMPRSPAAGGLLRAFEAAGRETPPPAVPSPLTAEPGMFPAPPPNLRERLEGLQDGLAALRGRRAELSRIQSPSFAGPDGAILSYHARNDSPALTGQIRALDEQIGRAYEEIAAIEGPIRAKLAENRAELKRLRAVLAQLEGYQSNLAQGLASREFGTYIRTENIDVGGQIHQHLSRIEEIEKQNAELNASLPRSWLRRWLASLWDAMVKTYAKAGEYSIK